MVPFQNYGVFVSIGGISDTAIVVGTPLITTVKKWG